VFVFSSRVPVNVLYVWLHDAQYDLDVISFDRDLVNSMFTRAERKAELKSSLDAQVADERRRKQQGSVLLFCCRARGSVGTSGFDLWQHFAYPGPSKVQQAR
jgi:hypothetical protein